MVLLNDVEKDIENEVENEVEMKWKHTPHFNK